MMPPRFTQLLSVRSTPLDTPEVWYTWLLQPKITLFSTRSTAPPQLLITDLQGTITEELADELYDLIWIEAFDNASCDFINWREAEVWRIADGDGMIIASGNIYYQEDGSAQLSFFMTCAQMCGIGKNFVLEKHNGVWLVIVSVGQEIAS